MTQQAAAFVFGIGMLVLALIVAAICPGVIGLIAMICGVVLLTIGIVSAASVQTVRARGGI